jgi:hypothetical protein
MTPSPWVIVDRNPPAYWRGPTRSEIYVEQGKPVVLAAMAGEPQGTLLVLRVWECGKGECHPLMGWIFNRLDKWVVRRKWSHRTKRWRNAGWRRLPTRCLYGEYGLVNLVGLIPSIAAARSASL